MKLSELISFRNRLDTLPVNDVKDLAKQKLNILTHTIEHPVEQSLEQLTQPLMNQIESSQVEIWQAFDRFDQQVSLLKDLVRLQIAEQEKQWFQTSYKLFEEAETCETTEQILYNRRSTKQEKTIDAEETLRARLSNYGDWRFAGMIIRPGIEDFIDNMVGFDPLYIIDRNYELLAPALERFPKLYQNRLRPYTVNDWSSDPLLGKIPNEQFGLCLAYNVFNYRPLEIIRKYLQEIYQKLRPGGVLLMTYNDCDLPQAVMLVENFYASYTPGYLIRDLAQNIGYKLTYSWSDNGPSVWLELRKPGELTSLRGGQAIAKLQTIENIENDMDFLLRKHYSREEISQLQLQATELDINRKLIKRAKPFELKMLINTELDKRNQVENLEREKQRIESLTKLANQYGIDVNNPDWENLIRKAQARERAIAYNIDINDPNWENIFKELLRKKEEEQKRLDEEDRKRAIESEKKRIQDLHNRARSFNINPELYDQENEIHRLIAETIDQQKKEELKQLRQRATELQVGNPNMVRYGYSAEKLKQLIKEKEEGTS